MLDMQSHGHVDERRDLIMSMRAGPCYMAQPEISSRSFLSSGQVVPPQDDPYFCTDTRAGHHDEDRKDEVVI